MNINRNNYEVFFLLYVDNELSAPEKNTVEIFLQNNPDLQEEMTMLQQSIVKPDTVVFENKKSLLKEEAIADADEKLLLLLDNELVGEEKAAIKKLIVTDAPAKAAWQIFQQTKLSADDAIVFADKQSLYRKEGGRVVAFRWWRVAVAAAFIGFAILGGIAYYNSTGKIGTNQTAVAKPVILKNKPVQSVQSRQIQPGINTTANETTAAKEQIQKDKQGAEKITVPKDEKISPQPLNKKENDAMVADKKPLEKPSNNLPRPYFDNVNKPGSNNTEVATVSPKTQEDNSSTRGKNNGNEINNKDNDNAVAAVVPASFTDTPEENKDQPFFEEERNKKGRTKLGGFFKKMKRVFERKTNTSSNDNNIRVANMSFAVQ